MARFVALLLLDACSCSGNGASPFADLTFTPAPSTAFIVPGVGTLSFTTEATGTAHAEFGLAEDALDLRSPSVDVSAGAIELRGLRLGPKLFAKVVLDDGSESEVISFQLPPPPDAVPSFEFTPGDPSKSCLAGGYVLFSTLGQHKSGVGVVDRDGQYVWAAASDEGSRQIARVRPGRDGQSLLWNRYDEGKEFDVGEIVRVPFADGTSEIHTRTVNGHHDFVELPDGRLAWMAYDRRRAPGLTLPDDPICVDKKIEPDENGELLVAAEALYVGDEGLTEANAETATQIWNQWDDYPQGVYGLPAEACDFLADGSVESAHGNSLAYVEATDTFVLGWRWLDTVLQIGGDGSLGWQWGGPYNELAGDPADLFAHSHFSDVWDGGMLMFDNRLPPAPSRITEYSADGSTYALLFESPAEGNEALLGDVRRMPIDGCDNLLVAFSQQGKIVELTRDGEVAWEFVAKGVSGNVVSRVFFVPDLYDLGSSRPY